MDDTEPLDIPELQEETATADVQPTGSLAALLSDAATEDAVAEDEATATATAPKRKDPVARALIVTALILVIALLSTTIALYIYLTTLNKAPRTAAERDITASEVATKERPKDLSAWSDLAYAYAAAGREDEALDAVKRGEENANSETLSLVRADVLRYSGDHEAAVKAYNVAEKKIKAMIERFKKQYVKKGVAVQDMPNDSLGRVYWGRALSKIELGDKKTALADMEKASKELPRQSTLWVQMGDLYAELKQPDKARAAYESALKFVPDMQEAKAGLERLEQAGE